MWLVGRSMFRIAKVPRGHVTPSAGVCLALVLTQQRFKRAVATQHTPAAPMSHRVQRHAVLRSNAASVSRADIKPSSGVCRSTATGISQVQLTCCIELRWPSWPHQGHACISRADMCRHS